MQLSKNGTILSDSSPEAAIVAFGQLTEGEIIVLKKDVNEFFQIAKQHNYSIVEHGVNGGTVQRVTPHMNDEDVKLLISQFFRTKAGMPPSLDVSKYSWKAIMNSLPQQPAASSQLQGWLDYVVFARLQSGSTIMIPPSRWGGMSRANEYIAASRRARVGQLIWSTIRYVMVITGTILAWLVVWNFWHKQLEIVAGILFFGAAFFTYHLVVG